MRLIFFCFVKERCSLFFFFFALNDKPSYIVVYKVFRPKVAKFKTVMERASWTYCGGGRVFTTKIDKMQFSMVLKPCSMEGCFIRSFFITELSLKLAERFKRAKNYKLSECMFYTDPVGKILLKYHLRKNIAQSETHFTHLTFEFRNNTRKGRTDPWNYFAKS